MLSRILRLEIRRAAALVGLGVRPVPRHAVVQARAARRERVGLADVLTRDEAQELAGHVAVERRRTEGVLGHRPARREAPELHVRGAGHRRRRRQHAVDRRVRMVVADRVDALEPVEVVLERARSCRATPRCRAASDRSRPPTARRRTWPRGGSRPRDLRTRRPAPGSRGRWPGRPCRSARDPAAAGAGRSSRRCSRALCRPAARRETSRRAAPGRSRRAARRECRARCAPSGDRAAARSPARRPRCRRSGRASRCWPRTCARPRPTAAADRRCRPA